jgi:hypothetical protein
LVLRAGAVVVALLAYPEPLYRYHAEYGRLHLYSDTPFDASRGRAALEEVERRVSLAPSPLADPHSTYRIFVSREPWRRRVTFPGAMERAA